MKKLPYRFYEFSRFRVDAAERRLWRDGQLVPLTPKVFDILLALVENSGHTLEKEELMDRVWADTFVEEGNLNRNVSTLRKALGDNRRRQRFIKTVPKLGYRFTADVRQILEDEEELLVEDKTRFQLRVLEEIQEEESGGEGEKRFYQSPFAVVGAVVLVVFAVAVSAWIWKQSQTNEPRSLVTETEKAEALKLYQRGRALWQTRDGKDLHEATLLLEQAVQKDPNLAVAHAALADAYAFDFKNWKKTEDTAREAIRLDPTRGEPHATIGFVKMFWEWKFQEAEKEFKQAVQLSPDYATAHQWYAINLHAFGLSGQAALVEMKKALELKPDSVSINADMCQTLYFLRRYEEALAQCRKTLAIDNKSHSAYQYLYEIYNAGGMDREAVETYSKIEEIAANPSPSEVQQELLEAYSTGGIRQFWKKRAEFTSGQFPQYYLKAQHFARLGEKDKALANLRQAYENHNFQFYLFLADPVFDKLRPDPRYKELRELLLSPEK